MNQANFEVQGLSLQDMAARCTSCGDCVKPCAFLQREGTPAAIAAWGLSEDNLRKAYECSLCGLCDALCPEYLSPSAMFLHLRRQAVANGILDTAVYQPWLKYEKLGAHPLFRRVWIPQGCTTLFFPGCSLPGRRPQAVRRLLSLLREQEPTAGLLLDCCGKISHDLGLEKNFRNIFQRLSQTINRQGIERILTACPGCSKIFRQYSENLEVLSIYEVLAKDLSPVPVKDDAPVVVIHDPCPARFDKAQQQAVRTLVTNAGWRIAELPESGARTRCCGQGGMVEGVRPGTVTQEAGAISAQAAKRRLVTSCASCAGTLERLLPTAHVADLYAGETAFASKQASSAKRWLNRLMLRFARLS